MNIHQFIKICMAIAMIVCLPWNWNSLEAADEQSTVKKQAQAPFETLSAEQVGQRANQLIESINAYHATFQHYQQAMKGASKEDELVIDMQIWSLQQRVLKEAHELADVLVELEKKSPQPELRQQIEAIFSGVLERFQYYTGRLRKEIDKARAGRTEAAADQRFNLEVTISRLTLRLDGFDC